MTRALLGVSDRRGIVEFARGLVKLGVEIIATDGTLRSLHEAGVSDARPVSAVTGLAEMLDGRVKTLHPAIHGGILARRDMPEHMAQLEAHGFAAIDIVCVSLYPFADTVAAGGSFAECIEKIDIGGPAMIRAAAKNHNAVTVVVDPDQYGAVLVELTRDGVVSAELRRRLAAMAFRHVAAYDAAVAAYLTAQVEGSAAHRPDGAGASGGGSDDGGGDDGNGGGDRHGGELPEAWVTGGPRLQTLRYGENPHQRGALYSVPGAPGGVALAKQLQGIALSFTNWLDLDAAYRLVSDFDVPAAAIIKHTNPCGMAVADDAVTAYRRAHDCDPRSAFGGIVALNRPVDAATAAALMETFLEAVIAPAVTPEAATLLRAKPRLRVLAVERPIADAELDVRSISGGLLVQSADRVLTDSSAMTVATARQPTVAEWRDLLVAWRVCRHVKSNAIVVVREGMAVGVGAGQMSRVEAAELAVRRGGEWIAGAVAASDAFFPMPDGLETLVRGGVTAVIQPGGSRKDGEVIATADAHGIAMVMAGERHFRH